MLPCLLGGCTTRSLLKQRLEPQMAIGSPAFKQSIGSLISPGFVGGNRIITLNNGDTAFPEMLRAIRGARKTINFETFVFYSGEVPQTFATALAERARAGVKVRVLLDAVGAAKSKPYRSDLRAAGVDLVMYRPLVGPTFHRFNARTHRKLLIIDGAIGFTGGMGIGDEWNGRAASPDEWRDIHYRVEGPVVAQMQGAFNDNWLKARREVVQGSEDFPALAAKGSSDAQFFFSSPVKGRASVELMYHLAIASARRSLDIANAYFLPDDRMTEALTAAARRGVRVRILMPGEHMDQPAVRRASRKRWPKLLKAGVELYEYEPTMMHTKLFIADGRFVSVGSTNLDPRSLRLNDEANLDVLDSTFARQQTAVFEKDLASSRRVTKEDQGPFSRLFQAPVQAAQTPVEPQL